MKFIKLIIISFILSSLLNCGLKAQELADILATEEEALTPAIDMELIAEILDNLHVHTVINQPAVHDLLSRYESFMGKSLKPFTDAVRLAVSQQGFIKLEINQNPLASYKDKLPLNDPSYIARLHSLAARGLAIPFHKESLIVDKVLEVKSTHWDQLHKTLNIKVGGLYLDAQEIVLIQLDAHLETKAVLVNGAVFTIPLLDMLTDFYYNNEQQILKIVDSYLQMDTLQLPMLVAEFMKMVNWLDIQLHPSRFFYYVSRHSLLHRYLEDMSIFLKNKNKLLSDVIRKVESVAFKDHNVHVSLTDAIEFNVGRNGIKLDKDFLLKLHGMHRMEPLEGMRGFVGGKIFRFYVDIAEFLLSPSFATITTKVNVAKNIQFDIPMDVSALKQ